MQDSRADPHTVEPTLGIADHAERRAPDATPAGRLATHGVDSPAWRVDTAAWRGDTAAWRGDTVTWQEHR